MQVSHSFWDVCQQYFAEGIVVPIFVIALVWLLKKWNTEKRNAFLAVVCAGVILIFNGFIYHLMENVGESSTYYRFFWICPISLIVTYFIIEIVQSVQGKQRLLLIIVMFLGGYMFSSGAATNWINLPENIYQLDYDVIQVADAIMVLTDGEPTTLIDNGKISSTIREYNAKIKFTELYTNQINQVLYTEKTDYLGKYIQDYISLNRSEYIAIEKEKTATYKVIESAGVKRAAETDGYYLYYVDHEAIDRDWDMLDILEEENYGQANLEYVPIPGLQERYDYVYISDFGPLENENVYREIINKINSLSVKGVFINVKQSQYSGWTTEYAYLLDELNAPYYCNDKPLQMVENEEFIFCLVDNTTAISKETLESVKKLKYKEKPVIMILAEKLLADCELYKIVTEDESPIIQILTVEKNRSEKKLINDSFLQFATPLDNGQLLNVIKVDKLEEQ